MTTIQLNAEILSELNKLSDNETLMTRVLKYIKRLNKEFASTAVSNTSDRVITPELAKEIEEARQEFQRGETLHFENAAAAQRWMDQL